MAGDIPTVPPATPEMKDDSKLPLGFNYAATSVPQASGVSGVGYFNGPWIIEGQNLHIGYWRMPRLTFSGVDLSLSSVTSIAYSYISTHLHAWIEADHFKVSSTDAYPVSGEYSQPQTFLWEASETDYHGLSYGSLDASALGPMGRISSKTPFYRRRLMTVAEQAMTPAQLGLSSRGIFGCNFLYGLSSCEWGSHNANQNNDQTFETAAMDPTMAGSFRAGWERWSNANSPINRYTLNGGYGMAQENLTAIVQFIDSCGWAVKEAWVDRVPGTRPINSNPQNYHSENANGQGIQNEYFLGIVGYDPNRHVHHYST